MCGPEYALITVPNTRISVNQHDNGVRCNNISFRNNQRHTIEVVLCI